MVKTNRKKQRANIGHSILAFLYPEVICYR